MKRENGFTLVEALIASFLTMVIIIGATIFISRTNAQLSAYTEITLRENQQAHLLDMFRADFDDAGHNMVPLLRFGSSQEKVETKAATTENMTFNPSTNPTQDPAPTVGTRGLYAPGWLQFKPLKNVPTQVGFVTKDGSKRVMKFDFANADPTEKIVYLHTGPDGSLILKESLNFEHKPRDRYRISVEGNKNSIKIKCYRVSNSGRLEQGHTVQASGDITYPLLPLIDLSKNGAVSEMDTLLSGPVVGAIAIGNQFLPAIKTDPNDSSDPEVDKGAPRLTDVVKASDNGSTVLILRGDPTIDSTYIPTNFLISESNSLQINTPCRGTYKAKDTIMLTTVEGTPKRTALFRVTNVSIPDGDCKESKTTLTLEPVRKQNPAWEILYSPPNDFQTVFKSGSIIARIAAPVIYSFDNDKGILYRTEGTRRSVAALGVKDFNVVPNTNELQGSFKVTCRLLTDSRITKENGLEEGYVTISYLATPLAINKIREEPQYFVQPKS
jgi:type II secretory pathway pseudopilin PulG